MPFPKGTASSREFLEKNTSAELANLLTSIYLVGETFGIEDANQPGGPIVLDANGNANIGNLKPYTDTKANLASVLFADGVIATTTDTEELIRGDEETLGGITINDDFGIIYLESNNLATPTDASLFYFGTHTGIQPTNVESLYRYYVSQKLRIYSGIIQCINTQGASTGSNESSIFSIRKNNTTDTELVNNFTTNTAQRISSFTLSEENIIEFDVGDWFVIKWETPTWATDPSNLLLSVFLKYKTYK